MRKQPMCNCKGCRNIGVHPVDLDRRGGRLAYLCDFHATDMESYYTENHEWVGTAKVHGYTYSVELETSSSSLKARAEIIANTYLPTSDSTVNCEYKSPIMDGLNALSKQCVTFEKLMQTGELVMGSNCGTHFHVGNKVWINEDNIDKIRRFYHSLFTPISDEMLAHPEETEIMFGRGFNGWANPINAESYPLNHTNWINIQHDQTIEFRICKFRNAKQYMNAVKFCNAAVSAIIKNFLMHFDDQLTEAQLNKYKTMTAYRRHKASVTAQKLVKLYRKYAGI